MFEKHNINDKVKFQLTPEGSLIGHIYLTWDDNFNCYRSWREGDWTEMPLWEFANKFGPYMYNGGPQLFVDNTITIEKI